MSQRLVPTSLLALLGLAGACEQPTAPAADHRDLDVTIPAAASAAVGGPTQPAFYTESGTQQPPPGYEGWITDLYVTAADWFMDGDPYEYPPDAYAFGQSVVNYNATNGTAQVTLTILRNLVPLFKVPSSPVERSSTFAGWKSVSAMSKAYVGAECNLVAHANAYGAAWNKAFVNYSWTTWGRRTDNDDDSAPGVPCDGNDNGGGDGDSDGGGGAVCYQVDLYEFGKLIESYDAGCW